MHRAQAKQIAKYVLAFSLGMDVMAAIAYYATKQMEKRIAWRDELLEHKDRTIGMVENMLKGYVRYSDPEVISRVNDETEFDYVVYQGMMPDWMIKGIEEAKKKEVGDDSNEG